MFSAPLVSMNLHFVLDISPPRAPGPQPAGCQRAGNRANTHPNKERVTGPAASGSHHYDTNPLHVVAFSTYFILLTAVKMQKMAT